MAATHSATPCGNRWQQFTAQHLVGTDGSNTQRNTLWEQMAATHSATPCGNRWQHSTRHRAAREIQPNVQYCAAKGRREGHRQDTHWVRHTGRMPQPTGRNSQNTDRHTEQTKPTSRLRRWQKHAPRMSMLPAVGRARTPRTAAPGRNKPVSTCAHTRTQTPAHMHARSKTHTAKGAGCPRTRTGAGTTKKSTHTHNAHAKSHAWTAHA
jgi:hypothetical protein